MLGRQLARSFALACIGVAVKAVERLADLLVFDTLLPPVVARAHQVGEAELGEELLGPAPTQPHGLLMQAALTKRALIYHAVCGAFASLILLVLLRRSYRPAPSTVWWALGVSVLVLIANAPLRRLADRATCCVDICDRDSGPTCRHWGTACSGT